MKALLVCLIFLHSVAVQQPIPKPPKTGKTIIVINRTGTDMVGTSFLYALKEDITRSTGYTLSWDQYDSSRPMLDLAMVSIDGDKPAQGYNSSISIIVHKYGSDSKCPVMTTHLILNIGSQKYEEMAKLALANIDEDASK